MGGLTGGHTGGVEKFNSLITIELAKNRGGLGENNKVHSFLALIRFILGKKGRIS